MWILLAHPVCKIVSKQKYIYIPDEMFMFINKQHCSGINTQNFADDLAILITETSVKTCLDIIII